jgi:hypothetical protein
MSPSINRIIGKFDIQKIYAPPQNMRGLQGLLAYMGGKLNVR